MALFYFIIGILLFIGLILFHEWGHYLAARRNGIEVEEFGLGFPPRAKILGKRKGTIFSLNWLPLGGFVRLKGEHDSDTEKGTFGAATTWDKTKVMIAGVGMNLFAAFILFTVVAIMGMPRLLSKQTTVSSDTKYKYGTVRIVYAEKKSPADKLGLKAEDQIVSINGKRISLTDDLMAATKEFAGKKVTVNYVTKAGITLKGTTTLNAVSPYLGVKPYQDSLEIRKSTWSAPIVAIAVSKDFTIATFDGLGKAVKGLGSTVAGLATGNTKARQAGQESASKQVSGPLGIFTSLYQISKQGFALVLFVVALISLTLAIMNVLPIPALDGGRLFVMLLYRGIRKPLNQKTEERIHGTGFALLMVLFVVITILDIKRL